MNSRCLRSPTFLGEKVSTAHRESGIGIHKRFTHRRVRLTMPNLSNLKSFGFRSYLLWELQSGNVDAFPNGTLSAQDFNYRILHT